MALVVLNDADDHRSGAAANHRLPSALELEEVSSGLEDLVRYSMEASPQVRPKALAGTWTDHVDVPEADPVDHAERVMFGLGQHCVDGKLQPLGEFLEPGVCRRLQDHVVLRHQNAPRLFPVAVLPALPLDHLDRGGGAGGEGDLVDLVGLFDREAGSAEDLVDCGGVLLHLGDRAEAELSGASLATSPRRAVLRTALASPVDSLTTTVGLPPSTPRESHPRSLPSLHRISGSVRGGRGLSDPL